MQHPAQTAPETLLRDCEVTRTRRSGPGGQNRNKVETAIVLLHRPSGVRAEGSERRSQQQNMAAALFRLRVHLALQIRCPGGQGDSPTPLWQSRTRGGRLSINADHHDFPALLAEALDVIAAHEWDLAAAAQRLQVTGTQLVKLLKLEPRALEQVNAVRRERSLKPLR